MHTLNLNRFDYELPEHAIAQRPCQRRDGSKLMFVNRQTRTVSHHIFEELPGLLPAGTAFFRNDVRVLKARLQAQRAGGGRVECFLIRPSMDAQTWWCLVRPGKRLPVGAVFTQPDHFSATVLEKTPSGETLVRFDSNLSVTELAAQYGALPLPPYIERKDGPTQEDLERYNTVYADARKNQAVAAPTAGLHFTPELLNILEQKGFKSYNLTLDVGLGTFQPIQCEHVEDHTIHKEAYTLPQTTREALHHHAQRLAVGTTSLRAIESYFQTPNLAPQGPIAAQADIYIYPPFGPFHAEALLTNFHLPRSTLLCLVSAFLTPGSQDGIDWLLELYAQALELNYRFYSYGDAMLIL